MQCFIFSLYQLSVKHSSSSQSRFHFHCLHFVIVGSNEILRFFWVELRIRPLGPVALGHDGLLTLGKPGAILANYATQYYLHCLVYTSTSR